MALGGGVELALACHAIVATPKASLAFPETGIGIYPGLGGTQRTPRRIGTGLAKWLVLSGQTLGAEEARAIGLIDKVVPYDKIDAAIAETIAEGRTDSKRTVPGTHSDRGGVLRPSRCRCSARGLGAAERRSACRQGCQENRRQGARRAAPGGRAHRSGFDQDRSMKDSRWSCPTSKRFLPRRTPTRGCRAWASGRRCSRASSVRLQPSFPITRARATASRRPRRSSKILRST